MDAPRISYPATERDRRLSREEIQKKDEAEGRERIPAAALDQSIGMMAALRMVEHNNELMERTLKKFGCWNTMRSAEGMLRKGVRQLFSKMSHRQVDTALLNTQNAKILVSVRPEEMCVNLRMHDADVLADYAMRACNGCMRTGAESLKCPLRDVLDCIPGVDGDVDAMGMCPYWGR